MNAAEKIVDFYDRGGLTFNMALDLLVRKCTVEEIRALPEFWLSHVYGEMDRMPRDDQGWAKIVFLESWCGPGLPPTQDERRAVYRARIEHLRQELGRP